MGVATIGQTISDEQEDKGETSKVIHLGGARSKYFSPAVYTLGRLVREPTWERHAIFGEICLVAVAFGYPLINLPG